MTVEEKWKNAYCYQVFDDGKWSIFLKPRCNPHPGEPNMKVWISQYGREVAQYHGVYRGYGRFANHEELLPEEVMRKAEKTWKELCDGVYTEEKLQKLANKFIEKYEARERRALAALAAN